jgi:hypothetical protein
MPFTFFSNRLLDEMLEKGRAIAKLPHDADRKVERVTGIEPVYSAWKADVLAIVLYPPERMIGRNGAIACPFVVCESIRTYRGCGKMHSCRGFPTFPHTNPLEMASLSRKRGIRACPAW